MKYLIELAGNSSVPLPYGRGSELAFESLSVIEPRL
jgi:hypothetical protein